MPALLAIPENQTIAVKFFFLNDGFVPDYFGQIEEEHFPPFFLFLIFFFFLAET